MKYISHLQFLRNFLIIFFHTHIKQNGGNIHQKLFITEIHLTLFKTIISKANAHIKILFKICKSSVIMELMLTKNQPN